jgi:hypothetical protein
VVSVQGEGDLFDYIRTGHSPGGFPRGLNRRKKQGNQHADNGNDDEKFNERERLLVSQVFLG